MKNFFLKTGLTLLCLLIGLGSAWGDTATLTFSAACGGSGTDSQGNTWTVTSDAAESTYDGTKGIHYGTGSKAVSHLTLTCSAITGNITKIVVNASGASGTSAKLSATVGGNNFGTQEQSLTASNAAYTFSGSASGEIEIKTSQTSAKKALYVKSIEVTYTTSTTPIDPEVTFNNGSVKATKTLDLSNLFESTSNGAVTYSITSGESFASINGSTLTGIAEGSVTVQASQEATSAFNAATATATITVLPAPTTKDFTLITNANDLQDGMEIIITGVYDGGIYAISTEQKANNRGQINVEASNNVISVSEDSEVQIITLGKSGDYWTLGVDGGYLYAASSSSNYLRTEAELDNNGKWSISFNNDVPSVIAQGNYTHNVLQYNAGISGLFSCYNSASQSPIQIYGVLTTSPSIKADNTLEIPAVENDGTFNVTWTGMEDMEVNLYNNEACTVPFNGDWFEVELDDDNNVYYLAGENTSTTSRTVYMQLYSIDSESNEYTHVVTVTQAGKQGDQPIPDFIKTSSIDLVVGDTYDIRGCLTLPEEYTTEPYKITTSIGGEQVDPNVFSCVYPEISFKQAGTYTVHVVAAAIEGKYAETSGDITVNVTETLEEITTIEDLYTFATTVGEKDGEKNEHGDPAKLTFDNWVVTGVKNSGTQTYVTDGTKGFIIYGTSAGFEEGDIISGTVNVRVSLYHGAANVEDVKATTDGITVTKNGTVTPVTTTINDLSAINTGSVVSLQNLTWNSTDKVFSDGTNTIAYFNGIIPKDDTAPTLENGKKYNITGVYLQWNTINYDVTPHTTTATIGEIMPRSLEDVELITEIIKYKVTIEAPEHGTLVVKHGDDTVNSGDEFEEGEKLQITATPDADYKFRNWQAYDGTTHTFTTSFEWEMSANDVTLTANFDEIQDYTIAWSVNGKIVKSETLEEDVTVVPVQPTDDLFTAAVPTGVTKVFTGWVTTPIVDADATPSYVTPATTATETVTYYAVFAKQEGEGEGEGGDYVLVESALEDWTGDYLIAYSDDVFADGRSGGTAGLGKAQSHVDPNEALSTDKKTVAAAWGDTYHVTLEESSENSKTYVLKTQDGNYNYQSSNTNGLASTENKNTAATYPISVNFNSSEDISLALGGNAAGAVLHYNANAGSSGEMFRFYKNGGQQPIYLYKKSATTGGATYSDFTTLVSCEISISQYGATSFSVPRNYTMPTGITGKTITANKKVDSLGDGYYKLTYSADYEEGSVVPAGESLVLYGEQGNYTIIYEGTPEKTWKEGNLLHGVYEAKDGKFLTTYDKENSGSYYYYKLTTQSGKNFGWYYGATEGAPFLMSRDDRAYLVIEKEIAAGIRGFALEDGEEEDLTTGIDNMETNSTNSIYNLQGLQQSKLQKGINIVNGKKVIR